MLNVLQPVWLEMGLHGVTYADLYMYIKALPLHAHIYTVYIKWTWSPTPNNLPPHALCSWSSFWNNELNNYLVTSEPYSHFCLFPFQGQLDPPPHSLYCPSKKCDGQYHSRYWRQYCYWERKIERGNKKPLFKTACPTVNIWQISEVKINLESHQLKRKKATATGTFRRAWQELLHLIAPWKVHYLHFWVTRR